MNKKTEKKLEKEAVAQKQNQYILENYIEKGLKLCSEHLGLSENTVKKRVKFLGLKTQRERNPSYAFFEQFLNINSSNVAYFLGFLWADGSIKGKNGIAIEIANCDAQELKELFNNIGFWQIRHRQRQKNGKPFGKLMTCYSITDKRLTDFLKENDYENKSTFSPNKILSKIPKNLHPAFWRGYCDGDGTVVCSPQAKKQDLQIMFSSSYDQNWLALQSFLMEFCFAYNVSLYCRKKTNGKEHKSSCLFLRGTRREKLKFLELIYSDEEIGLKRKASQLPIIKEFVENSKDCRGRTFYEKRDQEILTLLSEKVSHDDIMQQLSITKPSLKRVIQRMTRNNQLLD